MAWAAASMGGGSQLAPECILTAVNSSFTIWEQQTVPLCKQSCTGATEAALGDFLWGRYWLGNVCFVLLFFNELILCLHL